MTKHNPKQEKIFAQDQQKESEFFNEFAELRDYDSLTPYGYNNLIQAFRSCLGSRLGVIKNAVDLGCGTGSFTRRFFGQEDIRTFGVDIAFKAIARAMQKNDGITYFVSDINQLGIKDNSVDLVILSGVLHHFPNMGPCLTEARRILKVRGIILSYDPHINNPAMWLYRHPASPLFSPLGKTANERLLSKNDLRQAFQQCGLRPIEIRAISGVGISYLESKRASFFLPVYNAFEALLGFTPLARLYGSFLIGCAEKQ